MTIIIRAQAPPSDRHMTIIIRAQAPPSDRSRASGEKWVLGLSQRESRAASFDHLE